eukprot:2783897-Prymnesium_polylepis.1
MWTASRRTRRTRNSRRRRPRWALSLPIALGSPATSTSAGRCCNERMPASRLHTRRCARDSACAVLASAISLARAHVRQDIDWALARFWAGVSVCAGEASEHIDAGDARAPRGVAQIDTALEVTHVGEALVQPAGLRGMCGSGLDFHCLAGSARCKQAAAEKAAADPMASAAGRARFLFCATPPCWRNCTVAGSPAGSDGVSAISAGAAGGGAEDAGSGARIGSWDHGGFDDPTTSQRAVGSLLSLIHISEPTRRS